MKNKKSITILMVAFTLASCQSYKRVPYLQSYESLTDKGYKEIVINEVTSRIPSMMHAFSRKTC